MKIAFSAYGNGWREKVDIRFGRAHGFFIVETENNKTSYLDNSANIDAARGAGTSAAQRVAEAGVELLITGQVGPNAGLVLRDAGVKVMSGVGYASIEEAYQRYQRGLLTEQKL